MASGAGTMPYTLGHAWLRPGPSRPEPPHPHLGHHLRGGEGGGGGDGPEPPHPPALRGGRPLFPPLALPPACGGLWAGDGARLLALRGLRQPDPGARPHLGEPERLHHRPERGPRPPPPEACRQGGGPGLPRGLSGLGRGGPPILRPLPAALQRGGPLDLPHRLGLRPLHRPPEVHARLPLPPSPPSRSWARRFSPSLGSWPRERPGGRWPGGRSSTWAWWPPPSPPGSRPGGRGTSPHPRRPSSTPWSPSGPPSSPTSPWGSA